MASRRAVAAVVALVLAASGCADRSPHTEVIDGVTCIVRRNGFGNVTALSCDLGEDDHG